MATSDVGVMLDTLERTPSSQENPPAETFDPRFASAALIAALTAPWWIAYTPPSSPTFLKEWAALVAIAFAGLTLPPDLRLRAFLARHPLVVGAAAMIGVLALQALFFGGVWPKAVLMAGGVAFFILCVAIGRAFLIRDGAKAFDLVASGLLLGALVSCLFAAAQLAGLDRQIPFVANRVDNRLYGNVLQANHFADLLWLGTVAACYLGTRRALPVSVAIVLVVVLEGFSIFTGSRTVWLFAVLLVALGGAGYLRDRRASGRLPVAFLSAGLLFAALSVAVAASGVLEHFDVASAQSRVGSAKGDESTSQRVWFWRSGLQVAASRPWLGVGAGELAGHFREAAVVAVDAPTRGADSQAHNLFIQAAAELGIPFALLLFGAVALWWVRSARIAWGSKSALAAFAMASLILIHANLEQPLAYLYFIAVFGVLVGMIPRRGESDAGEAGAMPVHNALRIASFATLAVAALTYVQFLAADKTTRIIAAQVRSGFPPQPTPELQARIDGFPRWSPYVDYVETVTLMAAVPTPRSAPVLAARCERAAMYGPTPYLLARCATIFQVAGQVERANDFAESLCRIYPGSAPVLAQSMTFVGGFSPEAERVRSSCAGRSEG